MLCCTVLVCEVNRVLKHIIMYVLYIQFCVSRMYAHTCVLYIQFCMSRMYAHTCVLYIQFCMSRMYARTCVLYIQFCMSRMYARTCVLYIQSVTHKNVCTQTPHHCYISVVW